MKLAGASPPGNARIEMSMMRHTQGMVARAGGFGFLMERDVRQKSRLPGAGGDKSCRYEDPADAQR
jgi:hypothetical protein